MGSTTSGWIGRILAAGAAVVIGFGPRLAVAEAPGGPAVRQLDTRTRQWTGDLDTMLERRVVRVLVPYSRSLYFNYRGRQSGISYEVVRSFEKWLNTKYEKQLGKRPLTVMIIPATRGRLLPEVVDGWADIAVGNITVTE